MTDRQMDLHAYVAHAKAGATKTATNLFPHTVADPEGVRGVQTNPPLEPKLFHFHGGFQEKLVKLHKSNPLS